MSRMPNQEESREMLKWLNSNRFKLLDSYKNQYVAYNAQRLIAHSESLEEVIELAEASGEPFLIYLVPPYVASVQILSIRFRSVVCH